MKTYDFIKAKRLIEENKENLAEACLGMHEDWCWTAEDVWSEGEYTRELPDDADEQYKKVEELYEKGFSVISKEVKVYKDILIGGIYASNWATPTLQLIFKDGSDKMIPCFNGESDAQPHSSFALGVLAQPVQDNITPLSEE